MEPLKPSPSFAGIQVTEKDVLAIAANWCPRCAAGDVPACDPECGLFVHGVLEDSDSPACQCSGAWLVWEHLELERVAAAPVDPRIFDSM